MKTITTWVVGLGLLTLPLASHSFAESAKNKTGDKTLESSQTNPTDRSDQSDQRRSGGEYPGLEQFPSQGTGQQSAEQSRAADQRQAEGSHSEGMRSDKPKAADETAMPDKSKAATKPGETDITNTKGQKGAVPDKYTILPVARGQKIEVNSEMIGSTVQNPKGETLGTLEQLIMDSETRKIEYAMVSIGESENLRAFPWSAFKVDKNSGNVVLNMTKEQLQPGMAATDQSPDLRAIEQQLQTLRQQESQKGGRPGLGITKEPATAGPHGETQVGGGGPSGDRALPPGDAPQFKGGK